MPENGLLNGSQHKGEKGYFALRKWSFPIFLILGFVEGREGRKSGSSRIPVLCETLTKEKKLPKSSQH